MTMARTIATTVIPTPIQPSTMPATAMPRFLYTARPVDLVPGLVAEDERGDGAERAEARGDAGDAEDQGGNRHPVGVRRGGRGPPARSGGGRAPSWLCHRLLAPSRLCHGLLAPRRRSGRRRWWSGLGEGRTTSGAEAGALDHHRVARSAAHEAHPS